MAKGDKAVLAASPVFVGLTPEEIDGVLAEVGACEQAFPRGAAIRRFGDELDAFPLVLEGLVQASRDDGERRQIIQQFDVGEPFAVAVPFSLGHCPVDITAVRKTRVLFLPADRLRGSDSAACKRVVDNLVVEMSHKVATLSTKISVLSSPRLSDRVLAYLGTLPVNEDGSVTLPFKYRELAEYLGVNKTSLSRTLGQMEEEGVLRMDGRTLWVVEKDKATQEEDR